MRGTLFVVVVLLPSQGKDEQQVSMATTVLEHCNVAPPPDAAVEHHLPLVHFDMSFLRYSPAQLNLVFYEIPCSKSEFLESIVPKLKTSLSLTLKHFLPFAGKIHYPLTSSDRPVFRYASGEGSLSLIIAESSADFFNLTGNDPRNADEFYKLTPQMPEAEILLDCIKIPVLAVQLTLFPNQGVCICLNNNHAIGDGATIINFFHAWASMNKFNGDSHLLDKKYHPFYDRSGVQDPNGLCSIRWNRVKMLKPALSPTTTVPVNEERATFVLSEAEIGILKTIVMEKRPELGHVSSFIVVSAHVWTSLVKSAVAIGEEVSYDEPEYFFCPVDCRTRLNPPLPMTYFGNCLANTIAESTHGRLKGNEGFEYAVEAVKDSIQKIIHNEKGVLDGLEEMIRKSYGLVGKRFMVASGSPRFDYYGADFGWGRPKKFEPLRGGRAVSFFKCREFQGGTEVSLSMAKVKMISFAAAFSEVFCKASDTES